MRRLLRLISQFKYQHFLIYDRDIYGYLKHIVCNMHSKIAISIAYKIFIKVLKRQWANFQGDKELYLTTSTTSYENKILYIVRI